MHTTTPVLLQDDETVAAVTTEKQREQFLAQLNDAEEWLYDAGEDAPAAEHQCVSATCSQACHLVAF